MVPLVQWPPELASAISTRLWDTFEACHDREELFVKCGKAMVHLFSHSLRSPLWVEWVFSESWHRWGGRSCFIRDAFMDGRIACSHLKNTQQEGARWKHKADMRTALRTMLVHGQRYRLSRPDHEQLIWYGDLQWRQNDGHTPGYEDFDWLVDYLADEAMNDTDDETVGDALLALSAMRGLGSDTKRHTYITALVRCMGPTRPPRVRHAALRSVSDARGELASITSGSMPQGVDVKLLDELSRAFLTAVRPNQDQTMHGFGADASFHEDRDRCYFRLIFALVKEDEWRQRLTRDGHLERCTSLFGEGLACGSRTLECYLAGILTYIDFPGNVPPFGPTQERWRTLIMPQWRRLSSVMLPDVVEAVPALVMATRQNLPSSDDGSRSMELTSLARDVHGALESLQEENAALLNFGLVSQPDADAALSSLQGFHDDLGRMTENLGTLQKDTGSLGY
ncbi:hypothetical protein DEU56DRAFT_819402 [Suillus clintonianus]|uniref:uncharacterized protein n=1 Tax=Suillus clintonianus TaxID=1904413 RepID=UPI001B87CE90|nr:uncharacterized protein DEU56DRAFT_819402 [Suillus clintonianus]KAG2128254.1 hypothetical protein DEU56DRAFT_819402 [Suillus clintonianus]